MNVEQMHNNMILPLHSDARVHDSYSVCSRACIELMSIPKPITEIWVDWAGGLAKSQFKCRNELSVPNDTALRGITARCLVSLVTSDIAKPEATSTRGSFLSSGDPTSDGNGVHQCCLLHPPYTNGWLERTCVFSAGPASLLRWPSEECPVIDNPIPGFCCQLRRVVK